MINNNLSDSNLTKISRIISDFFATQGVSAPEISLDQPEFSSHGDVSTNASLRYARELGKNPFDLATDLAEYLKQQTDLEDSSENNSQNDSAQITGIEEIRVVRPGYVNIFFNQNFFGPLVKEIIADKSFGTNKNLEGQTWVVEHTSPNPNKAMHLGHLRNNLVGMSLTNLLESSGAKVSTDAVMNDRGIAIAKMMYGFLHHMQKGVGDADGFAKKILPTVEYWLENQDDWYTPEDLKILPDVFVTKSYVAGENDFKESEIARSETRDLVIRWENKDRAVWKLWSHILSYSYAGIERTLSRLGNRFDKTWYEHEHYQAGKDLVDKGLEKGIFKKLPDDAILTDLSVYKIPDTILLKNDGTSLYITQDLALTELKKNTYHADKLVWVVGPEQSLAMKQLFAVCEQLGISKREDLTHVTYGYVGLKDEEGNFKKMASRDGSAVLIEDVIDVVKEKIAATLKETGRVEEKKLADTAEKLALAAVKFSILRSERNQDIAFDLKQSVQTKGDSGVYVLYTYARAMSLLHKGRTGGISLGNFAAVFYKKVFEMFFKKSHSAPAGDTFFSGKKTNTADPVSQKEVLRLLAFYPNIILRATESMSAHHVAQFLLELCGASMLGMPKKKFSMVAKISAPNWRLLRPFLR